MWFWQMFTVNESTIFLKNAYMIKSHLQLRIGEHKIHYYINVLHSVKLFSNIHEITHNALCINETKIYVCIIEWAFFEQLKR